MDNHKADTDNDYDSSVQVVRSLRNLPGFQLIQECDFIQLVFERCQQKNGGANNNYQNIALNIYSESLYQATTIKDDLARQEEGFQELSKYLYRIAYNFYLHQSLSYSEMVEKAQESIQIALERIFSHLSSVKTPGVF